MSSGPATVTEAIRRGLPDWVPSSRIELQEYVLVGFVGLLLVVGAILEPGTFVTKDNLYGVLRQASVTGVVAIGMTFVIATRGIDLSVGSMLAAASIAGGQFADDGSVAFILGALGMGILLGGINAGAIAYGRVVPFIATLAMFTMARGIALWISDKTPISVFDLEALRWFGNGEVFGEVPAAIVVFLGVTAAGWILLNRTRYGRYVVAVGGNREAARIAGVPVRPVIFSVYVLSGLCVGIAAVLLTGRLASASPVAGNLLELDAIAAVVIGGTSLAGGRASIVGTFLGVLTFALIFNLLTLMDLPIEVQQVTKGVIILAAVLIQRRELIQ
jgi:ribose transport system permease protein